MAESSVACEKTAFLNVDLELFGNFDRRLLLGELGGAVVILHEGDVGSDREPSLVLELDDGERASPAERTARLVALVEKLSAAGRAAWDAASKRQFNVGIDAGLHPHETAWTFPPELLAAIARVRADLVVTVYGAGRSSDAPRPPTAGPRGKSRR